MFVITHALLPAVLAAPLLPRTGRREFQISAATVALSGALPDILTPHLSLAARYASWSHSIFAWAAFAVLLAILGRRWLQPRVIVFAIAAYALHLAGDAIAGGIAWAYPFSHDIIVRRWVPYRTWPYIDAVMVVLAVFVYWRFAPAPAPDTSKSGPHGQ